MRRCKTERNHVGVVPSLLLLLLDHAGEASAYQFPIGAYLLSLAPVRWDANFPHTIYSCNEPVRIRLAEPRVTGWSLSGCRLEMNPCRCFRLRPYNFNMNRNSIPTTAIAFHVFDRNS